MDRASFYAALRRPGRVFGGPLSQEQVNGLEAILDECEAQGAQLEQTAYILATAYGETGGTMQPRRENMNYSAKRLREVWPSRFRTDAEAQACARNPRALANKVYNGRMGNRPGTSDGWDFRGNGIGQITGRYNHEKWGKNLGIDLVNEPWLMEDLEVSVRSLVRPMLEGWATGKKLSDYVDRSKPQFIDYLGARRVWGGVDAAKYADYADDFETVLKQAGYAPRSVEPPKPDRTPSAPPVDNRSPWAVFMGALLAFWERNRK